MLQATKNSGQFNNTDELVIATAVSPGKRDPLLIEEAEESKDQLLLVNRSITADGPVKTYTKKWPKKLKRLKTLVPNESLKSMVYEALERQRRIPGTRTRDIKRFILSKYDLNVGGTQIYDALKEGLASGEVLQLKRKGLKLMQRFRLSKYQSSKSKRGPKRTEDPASMRGSEFNDIEFIDSNFLKVEEISEGESSSLLGNGKRANISGLGTRVQKRDDDPIYANEIDFMVLHSLYSSQNTAGLRINEIAEFIRSFYGVDGPDSLPRIERYLNYSIEKGVLTKNGDKYKKTLATWKVNSGGKIASPELQKSRSACPSKKFFLTEVKLEPGEAENFLNSRLATDHEKVEINVNNNVVRSIGTKPEPRIVKTFKIKRKNFISGKNVPYFSTIPKDRGQNVSQHSKIEPGFTRLEGLKNTKVPLVHCDENKKQIKVETIEPSGPSKSGVAVPVSTESIVTLLEQNKCTRIFSELNDAFQTPTYYKHNISVFQFKKREALQKPKARGHYNLRIKPSSYRHGKMSVRKYRLGFVIEYLSHHPMTVLKNPGTSTRNLSWKEISLENNNICLKLTGESTPSSEALYCMVCGSQLTFGPPNCPVCSFELENVIEKCEICDLLCNRGDVFLKHFLWEHSPTLVDVNDDDSLSVAEENIIKMLKKLADGNLFHCRLCMYLANNREAFEVHIVSTHTTRTNVFPPLPEVEDPDKISIFRNEISNTCCYKCDECGFISNRRDFAVYHMLEVHIVVETENYDELLWNLETEDMKRNPPAKSKPHFGLCSCCGKFYNNVASHMEMHNGGRRKTLQRIEGGKTLSLADGILQKSREIARRNRARLIETNQLLCHICGKRITRRLQQHLRCHNSEMYPCTICGKEFNRQSNLFTHKRVHTREKPFQCDICEMSFGYKCSIKGHIINVHSETVR